MVQRAVPGEHRRDNFIRRTRNVFEKKQGMALALALLLPEKGHEACYIAPFALPLFNHDQRAYLVYLQGINRTMFFSSSTCASADIVSLISSSVVSRDSENRTEQ